MIVGLLGLQGAFLDHIPHLKRCGVDHTVVREAKGLEKIDRLIIPGGESTVMTKFLHEYGMTAVLKERIANGMPTWGVCAGAILLSATVDGERGPLGKLPINIIRNAYGRQSNSSQQWIELPLFDIGRYPAIFIRAPKIASVGTGVSVYATCKDDPVFVQNERIMATTFHPELNREDRFHRYFLSI